MDDHDHTHLGDISMETFCAVCGTLDTPGIHNQADCVRFQEQLTTVEAASLRKGDVIYDRLPVAGYTVMSTSDRAPAHVVVNFTNGDRMGCHYRDRISVLRPKG